MFILYQKTGFYIFLIQIIIRFGSKQTICTHSIKAIYSLKIYLNYEFDTYLESKQMIKYIVLCKYVQHDFLHFLYSNIQHKKCVKLYNLLFYLYQHIKLINNLKGINSLIGNISKINHI